MVLLNADLGEGHDDVDRKIMPFISQANIACGGHTGDQQSVVRTIKLAQSHNVAIGAHPSYVDRVHFGRQSIAVDLNQLELQLIDQISLVADTCLSLSTNMSHIKAHGALYNDSNNQPALMHLLLQLAHRFQCSLMIQSLPEPEMDRTLTLAKHLGVNLIREGFTDRAYLKSGRLAPRSVDGAVFTNIDTIMTQALQMLQNQPVQCIDSKNEQLLLTIDSLCVHGDNELALNAVTKIYDAIN